jgi:hypothetical protein
LVSGGSRPGCCCGGNFNRRRGGRKTALHDKTHALQRSDIGKRIILDRNEIRIASGLNRADVRGGAGPVARDGASRWRSRVGDPGAEQTTTSSMPSERSRMRIWRLMAEGATLRLRPAARMDLASATAAK